MTTPKWRTVAWNGVSFSVPGEWEPARIGRRHLVFAGAAGPAMEIKWQPIRGRFSSRRILRRLARHGGGKHSALQDCELPAGWRAALADFEAVGFKWDAGGEKALGASLYCTACRTASLIQFFQPPQGGVDPHAVERLLASFRDHRRDDRTAWALFDIAALLPGHFQLFGYRFEAGRFMMRFKGRGRRLALYRWAPAGALLAKRSLAEFTQTLADGLALELRPLPVGGLPGIEAREPRPAGRLRRMRAWLGLSVFRRLRIWHVADRNRILGVSLEGRWPIEEEDFGRVQFGLDGEEKADAASPFPR